MGTHCYIAEEKDNDMYRSIYCHLDGYPEEVGKLLVKYYDTTEKLRELLALGDVYCLQKKLNPDPSALHSLTSPMPSGSTDEGYVLSIKGSGTEKLPVLSFESPGVHTYTISQIKGSNSQCSYDETVYTMKVYVTNNENGPGLVSEIVLTVPGMDGKPEHIIFVNKYPTVPDDPDDPDGPQTGDSSHLWLYICLGAVSLTALVTLFLTKRRKSEQ